MPKTVQPSTIVFEVASALAALAVMLDDVETIGRAEAEGVGVICGLLRDRLDQAGAELLDQVCEQLVAA